MLFKISATNPDDPKLPWEAPLAGELTGAEAQETRRLAELENWPEAELVRLATPAASDGDPGNAKPSSAPEPKFGIGHNRPPISPSFDDKEARKTFFVAEIRHWLAHRQHRPADYMAPKEIGAAKDRGFLLNRSILDNVATFYRQHPRTPLALGVLVVDTVLSDNDEGCSTASAMRVAELLGCDEKYVRRARKLLGHGSLLGRAKSKGLSDRHWPIINRAFAGQGTSAAWWLDATSDPPAPRGRPWPVKPRTSDVRSLPDKPRTS